MTPPLVEAIAALVRRALLDLLSDIGGEHSDEVLTLQLRQLGHRVARRDVAEQLRWLAGRDLVFLEEGDAFLVARAAADGRDVASGALRVDGVARHKTGE